MIRSPAHTEEVLRFFLGRKASGTGRNFDIDPDGDRFLAISPIPIKEDVSDATVPKFNIVLNWFEELEERVPVP